MRHKILAAPLAHPQNHPSSSPSANRQFFLFARHQRPASSPVSNRAPRRSAARNIGRPSDRPRTLWNEASPPPPPRSISSTIKPRILLLALRPALRHSIPPLPACLVFLSPFFAFFRDGAFRLDDHGHDCSTRLGSTPSRTRFACSVHRQARTTRGLRFLSDFIRRLAVDRVLRPRLQFRPDTFPASRSLFSPPRFPRAEEQSRRRRPSSPPCRPYSSSKTLSVMVCCLAECLPP